MKKDTLEGNLPGVKEVVDDSDASISDSESNSSIDMFEDDGDDEEKIY